MTRQSFNPESKTTEKVYQVIGHTAWGDYVLQECETMEDAEEVKASIKKAKWSGVSIRPAQVSLTKKD